jgi:hypothetical protein
LDKGDGSSRHAGDVTELAAAVRGVRRQARRVQAKISREQRPRRFALRDSAVEPVAGESVPSTYVVGFGEMRSSSEFSSV